MDLAHIKEAFDRVSKKQKVSESKTLQAVDSAIAELQCSIQKLSRIPAPGSGSGNGGSGGGDDDDDDVDDDDDDDDADPRSDQIRPQSVRQVLEEIHGRLTDQSPSLQEVAAAQKDLHLALGKYGKLLEKSFCTDMARACWDVDWPEKKICEVIALHFYRQGMFDLGDSLVEESLRRDPPRRSDDAEREKIEGDRIADSALLKAPFLEMYKILEGIRARNLDLALEWAESNREYLAQKGSCFEFDLHRLQFLQLLHKGLRPEALKYARERFGRFSPRHMADIQRLMCCLLWAGRLESCPYSGTFWTYPEMWEEIGKKFAREACSLLGEAYESPLKITLSAGSSALPTLLKMATVLSASKKQEWQQLKQLPIEIELGNEFQFHSIFACPVSKDQSSADNPPMLMPCCHVLCKQTLQKLAKNRSFKCPYCPTEVTMNQCKPVYF
jgi:hypothetical protein